jgi:hypothetical protein
MRYRERQMVTTEAVATMRALAARFPLHEGAKAPSLLARGSVRGKIVLAVGG